MSGSGRESTPPVTPEEILKYLKRIAQENLDLKPEQITGMNLDTPIVEGLQLDSLAQVTLITAIESDFGFEFELEDREQIHSIRDLVRMIQARAAQALP